MVKKYNVKVNGKSYEVEVEEMQTASNTQNTQHHQEPVPQETVREQKPVQRTESQKSEQPQAEVAKNNEATSSINAPMSGLLIDVKVKKGDRVKSGDKLLVLEAMKMENDIVSDISGIIDEVHCKKGDNVETGETLISIS